MKKIESLKLFVEEHKVGLAVMATFTVTAVACLALNRVALTQHNDFLKEHDLYEEFYALDEV